jgi:hypothetical protein
MQHSCGLIGQILTAEKARHADVALLDCALWPAPKHVAGFALSCPATHCCVIQWKPARDNKIQYSVVSIHLVVNIEYFIIAPHLNTYRQTVSKYVV